ncbi:MAG: TonB-dependent receptor [Ferruginibacter sp.]
MLIAYVHSYAQNGRISGTVSDNRNQQAFGNVSIQLEPGSFGSITDKNGVFRVENIVPGTYTLTASAIGYTTYTLRNLVITSGNEITLAIELERAPSQLADVIVKSARNTAKATSLETPLSIQKLTTEDIRANPGGNFDISKVIQSLPGVGGGAAGGSFRNDIIIRGGAPSENVFFLDGIEVPLINHFGTQGSGGGPQGILNVSFIEEVKLSTSAFDAKYDNTLSSVFQFKQKNGNSKKVQGNIRVSATEVAATFDGPLSPKTTFLASARRSYLELLFQAIDLPIRPNYWDFQFKTNTRINAKNTLTTIGIGAIDEFRFASIRNASPEKLYVLNSNPIVNQWNYTVGMTWKHLTPTGYWTLSLSRNTLNNRADKFEDNDIQEPNTQTLLINSRETENKLRWNMNSTIRNWTISYGATAQYVDFDNRFEQTLRKTITNNTGDTLQNAIQIRSNTAVGFLRYGAFIQAGRLLLNNRIAISLGARVDGNNASNSESNPLEQFSPRMSIRYTINDQLSLNASAGSYFRLPAYTQLAFQNASGILSNSGKYIQSTHLVTGIEYLPNLNTRFTLEGFYKKYANYPISILDGISLANKGTEFGAIGNEPVTQNGKGRAFGFELFAQQKLTKRLFGVFSYTFFNSEFTGVSGIYQPASWDNRHLISFTGGYKLNRNWEIGLKFRYQGAAPYTPFDATSSQLNYLSQGVGVFDYSKVNSLRLPAFHAADLRIDKKWNFRKQTIDLFLDIQNLYGAASAGIPNYTFQRNESNTAFLTTDNGPLQPDGSNAIPLILSNRDGNVLPTIGLIVEF